jgi:type IX secretion system PorP/SprF family membrane protein
MKLSMKRILSAVLLTATTLANAQQDAQFSQYMFNRAAYNPAATGLKPAFCIHGLYRNQWMGFPQAPKSLQVVLDAPFNLFNQEHGFGLTFNRDQIGYETMIQAKLAYSYHIKFGSEKSNILSLGLDAGIINRAFDASQFNPAQPGDNSIPTSSTGQTGFDMGFGAAVQMKNFHAGISMMHLVAPELKFASVKYNTARNLYFNAGYDYAINPKLTLQPTVLVMSDLNKVQATVNATILYNDKIWGGLGYRVLSNDALVALVGFKVKNIKVGVSYDLNLNALGQQTNGGFEIMAGYCSPIIPRVPPAPLIHRNTRFL